MQILPKIIREPTREYLINIDRIISGNDASVASNIGGVQHSHILLIRNVEYYLAQTFHTSIPPHNPGNYPSMIRTDQEEALGT